MSISYKQGNLLESSAAALVNTVNTVGVMGKGIALQFKRAYPYNYKVYRQAYLDGTLATGMLLIVQDVDQQGPRTIVNFPTKEHWRAKSRYSYIETGLEALRRELTGGTIPSIALPPLGCGNGGLDWAQVKHMIEDYLHDLRVDIELFEPNPNISKHLSAIEPKRQLKMTPQRAMLLHGLYHYEQEGEPISLFVANKVAYFLQLLGQPMRLTFKKHYYGPYAPQLNSFVQVFRGSFIQGNEQGMARPFDSLRLNYDRYQELSSYINKALNAQQVDILEKVDTLLTGYKSAHALEVLATVAWIHSEHPNYGPEEIMQEAEQWSSRKAYLLQLRHVQLALERLQQHATGNGLFA